MVRTLQSLAAFALALVIVVSLAIPPSALAIIGWANYQWPCNNASYADNQDIAVYSQVWKPGCTESPGPCPQIQALLFFKRADEPTFIQIPMNFNVDVGSNDEYWAMIPAGHTQAGIQEQFYIQYRDLSDMTIYDPIDHCGGGVVPPMVLNITGATSVPVTVIFSVDMNCLTPDLYNGGAFLAGDFTGWLGCDPMAMLSDPESDGIYQGQWHFPPGSNPFHEFKFNRLGTDGCNWENSIPNRSFVINESQPIQFLPTVRWDNWECAPAPCPCPNPEQEPNDAMPAIQTINIGDQFCGTIDHVGDMDHIRLNQNMPAALRIHLWGDAGPLPCPGGMGLHPSAQILAEDGDVIAFMGDTTNRSTYFETTFELGPYPHIIKIGGARGTTGPYIIQTEIIPLSLVSAPPPQLTINTSGGVTRLYWNDSYLAGESVTIEQSLNPDGPWSTYGVFFGGPNNVTVPTGPAKLFFRAHSNGERPASPFVGSILPLSEPGPTEYDYNEVGQFQIQEVEWGRNAQGDVGMTRVVAQGIGPSTGEMLNQDNRSLYLNGYEPITNFAGTKLNIFGRNVQIEHCAFARDLNGIIGIVDGRGRNETGDSLMYFSDTPQYLVPNDPLAETGNWSGWFWFDFCPEYCCRLNVIAFCRSTFLAWNAACAGPVCPGNPSCWLGCPCPPMDFMCTPPVPGCSPCDLVPDPGSALIRWCTCRSINPPTASPFCFFQIWVKCRFSECRDVLVDCFCPGAPPCPTYPVWTVVPFVDSAMRAACRVDCTF